MKETTDPNEHRNREKARNKWEMQSRKLFEEGDVRMGGSQRGAAPLLKKGLRRPMQH